MILQALYELAQREGLVDDPDFEPKPVAWLVHVGPDGAFLGFEDTRTIPPDQQGRKKPKRFAKRYLVPREKPVTRGDRAFLLYNKAEYAFGIDPDGKRDARKLRARFDLFRRKVLACLDQTGDDGVRAVYHFLGDVATDKQAVQLPADCASNDLFAFVYQLDVECIVTDRPLVRQYWQKIRRADGGSAGTERRCLVSGAAFFGAVQNFPPIKRVPGGTTSGVAIVSFNPPETASSFSSYGWKGNENAPISREVAEACATALNRLLDPAYPNPRAPEQRLPPRSLRLSSDTAVCYWSAKQSGEEFCSAFGGLLEANPEGVKNLYQSIWTGKSPDIQDPSAFYALTLTGTQGRVIVRDWFESTIARVASNLAAHFEDLKIVRNTPKPKVHALPPNFSMTALFESLAPRGDRSKVPTPLIGQLLEAALRGTPYPFAILQGAIERSRAEVGNQEWNDLNRRDARAALIKAVLNRRKRFFPEITRYEEVNPEMDPNINSEGYVLGRLMAVLERVQQEAVPGANATIVDRYFSGASAAPKTVFIRLLKNARHHVATGKDEEARAGLVFRLDKLIDELASRFSPRSNGFPAHLDLEQQGLFILGYHQMRKWLWIPKEERERWEADHADAPREYIWSKTRE
jgi:CRISPR-associated protein Csd1